MSTPIKFITCPCCDGDGYCGFEEETGRAFSCVACYETGSVPAYYEPKQPTVIRGYANRYDECGETAQRFIRVKFPRGWSKRQKSKWASEEFSHHCQCVHDCCGHWQSHAGLYGAKRINKREYLISVSSYQNI